MSRRRSGLSARGDPRRRREGPRRRAPADRREGQRHRGEHHRRPSRRGVFDKVVRDALEELEVQGRGREVRRRSRDQLHAEG